MGEIDEFDAAVEQAWASFETNLTTALSQLGEDRLDVTIQCGRAFDLDEGVPWVWVDLDDDGVLRLSASPRDDLLARFRLRRWQRRRMVELGWPASTVDARGVPMVGTNVPPLRVAQAEAADLARLVIGLVREIWAVPHPAFLDVDDVLEPAPVEAALDDASGYPVCGESEELPPLPVVAWPTDRCELADLAARTLVGAPHMGEFDQPVEEDAHYLLCDGLMLRVGVHASMPIVELRACLLMDVVDPHRARLEVNLANRYSDVAHYVSAGTQVFADAVCPGLPFVPAQLRWVIATFIEEVAQAQVPMQERLDASLVRYDDGSNESGDPDAAGPPGEVPEEDGDDQAIDWSADQTSAGPGDSGPTELPEQLMTLLQLDHDGETPLEPRLVSSVCDHDRGLLLRLMRLVEVEVISWGSATEAALSAADSGEAAVCEGERTSWERTLSQLRAALRYLVEHELHEEAA
jgi:hypothetical protein